MVFARAAKGKSSWAGLKILPFTRLCVRCQEENEKESKRQKTLENERSYRKLDLTDMEEDGFLAPAAPANLAIALSTVFNLK